MELNITKGAGENYFKENIEENVRKNDDGREAGEPLPERWYLAAPWPQCERQLGRESERRLLASTDRAAITAPIMLFSYDDGPLKIPLQSLDKSQACTCSKELEKLES